LTFFLSLHRPGNLGLVLQMGENVVLAWCARRKMWWPYDCSFADCIYECNGSDDCPCVYCERWANRDKPAEYDIVLWENKKSAGKDRYENKCAHKQPPKNDWRASRECMLSALSLLKATEKCSVEGNPNHTPVARCKHKLFMKSLQNESFHFNSSERICRPPRCRKATSVYLKELIE
jgi:hypothetical protein